MTTTEERLIKLCSRLIDDFTRATNELAAADRHLNVIFTALHKGGLTYHIIRTGFSPALYVRAIQICKAELAAIEDDTGGQKQ